LQTPNNIYSRWDSKLRRWGESFGQIQIRSVLESTVRVYPYEVEGDGQLLSTKITGDFIIRDGAPKQAILMELQKVLNGQFNMPVRLVSRQVERPVIVARGAFGLKPIPDRRCIELFEEALTDESRGGGGSGNFEEFLNWVGRYINMHVIDEVEGKPKEKLSWHYNRKPRGRSMDPLLVLDNLSPQTGLTFTEETRRVRVLFVEQVQ